LAKAIFTFSKINSMQPVCKRCGAGAEIYLDYARVSLCPDCFKNLFERKVKETVLKYKMIERGDRVAVAASGGKDSSALLSVLRRIFPDIELAALHINLGIDGYSDECERKLTELTKRLDVDLKVFSLKKELGFSMGDFKRTVYGDRICAPCGTIKRYLINKLAHEGGFTKLATGHNLDDIAEVLFNCYLQGDVNQIAKLRPVLLSAHPKLVCKIKPLWAMTEMEDLLYASYSGLPFRAKECPFSRGTRSLERKRLINDISVRIPGFKHTFVKSHLKKLSPLIEKSIGEAPLVECEVCGMPSSSKVCAFCRRVQLVKS
jgi:uncharacterized protein (TIGR00269 family)